MTLNKKCMSPGDACIFIYFCGVFIHFFNLNSGELKLAGKFPETQRPRWEVRCDWFRQRCRSGLICMSCAKKCLGIAVPYGMSLNV